MSAFAYINIFSCALMMVYLFYVAVKMPNRGMWVKRIAVIGLAAILCFQISDSLRPGHSPWHEAILHLMLAACLLVWRKEAIMFVKCRFTAPEESFIPKRSTDVIDMTDPRLHSVRGTGKE